MQPEVVSSITEQIAAMQFNDRSPTKRRIFDTIFAPEQVPTDRTGLARQSGEPATAPPGRSAEPEAVAREGLYIISVAARILAMHPQTLRKYERVGLVRPSRTVGMLRLYSEEDIAKLRMIKHLVEEVRLNLAGVEMALAVFDRLSAARGHMGRIPTTSAQAFDRVMQEILTLLQGRQRPGPSGQHRE